MLPVMTEVLSVQLILLKVSNIGAEELVATKW